MQPPHTDTAAKPHQFGMFRPTETVRIDNQVAAIRIEDFFSEQTAHTLTTGLSHLVYERDDIADTKRVSRAARAGDLPDAPLIRPSDAPDMPQLLDTLSLFESPWLISELEEFTGRPLRVLRPPAPYRMDPDDRIAPHDDHAAPEYRLSLACNLTRGWQPHDGGETVIGLVDTVVEFDDPDFFFPLKKWTLEPGARTLMPIFNSALLLFLSPLHAHAVRPVRRGPRFSITTLYGDRASA